jgi:hypothetical protein
MTSELNVDKRRSPGRVLQRPKKIPGKALAPASYAADGPQDPQDGGGPVLAAARVRLIYWGSAWGTHLALRSQIDTAARSILTGGYVKTLSEYRANIGAGMLVESLAYAAGRGPADNFTDDEVQGVLRNMMTGGLLPQPTDDQHLYLVVTPPGVAVNGILGEHWYFGYACNDGTQRNVHYGWVTGTQISDYSCTMSHELVESITDPEMNAITFASCPGVDGTCEIGDVCDQCYSLGDGTVVQNWYSKKQRACVSPK